MVYVTYQGNVLMQPPPKESKTMTVLNWCYGTKTPTENKDLVNEQILLAHRYKNRLVELERDRRQAAETLAISLHPEFSKAMDAYNAADAKVEAAYKAVKDERIKQRKRVEPTEKQQEAIDAAKELRREASAVVKEHKAAAYAAVKDAQKPHLEAATEHVAKTAPEKLSDAAKKKLIRKEYHSRLTAAGLGAGDPEHSAAAIQARAECGVYWGTYLQIEDAAKDFRKGSPPKFRRWSPDGSISVQLQGGLTVQKATECEDTRLRIELPELTERLATTGHDKGKKAVGKAWVRIGSDGRTPIWTVVEFTLHRPLPEDGVIKWAHLDRRMTGEKEEWKLRLTLETSRELKTATNSKMVAIHIGHSQTKTGLTVATWRDGDGKEGVLQLPDDLIQKFTRPAELDAIREANSNVLHAELCDWIKSTDHGSEWLAERTEHIAHWRGPERLAKLVTEWRDHRFDADQLPSIDSFPILRQWALAKIKTYREKGVPIQTEISTVFDLLEFWRKADKHLGQWVASQVKKCRRRREYIYGEFCKQMSETYQTVAIANVNWKQLAETPEVDEDEGKDKTSLRRIARIASPGDLSAKLIQRFGDHVKLPAKNIKASCHRCGKVNKWNHGRKIHECKGCRESWKVIDNILTNIVSRGAVALADRMKKQGVTDEKTDEKKTARKARPNRRKNQVL